MSELFDEVRRRAEHRCEYCRLPQSAFRRPFHIEHVVARQHGGRTEIDNLALACWSCNLKKGPNLSGIEGLTGNVTILFNPRTDRWRDNFAHEVGALPRGGISIVGLTPAGRATIDVLGFNDEMRKTVRYELWLEGVYPAGAN
jgi:hypothetical protein